jgi:hypothetical protein
MSNRRHQLGFDHRLGTKKETITFCWERHPWLSGNVFVFTMSAGDEG